MNADRHIITDITHRIVGQNSVWTADNGDYAFEGQENQSYD